MNYCIIFVIICLLFYGFTLFAGYEKAQGKLIDDEPNASVWETLEHIFMVCFFICLSYALFSGEIDEIIWQMKNLSDVLKEAIAHG